MTLYMTIDEGETHIVIVDDMVDTEPFDDLSDIIQCFGRDESVIEGQGEKRYIIFLFQHRHREGRILAAAVSHYRVIFSSLPLFG